MCCYTGVCNVEYLHSAGPGLWAEIVSVSADWSWHALADKLVELIMPRGCWCFGG